MKIVETLMLIFLNSELLEATGFSKGRMIFCRRIYHHQRQTNPSHKFCSWIQHRSLHMTDNFFHPCPHMGLVQLLAYKVCMIFCSHIFQHQRQTNPSRKFCSQIVHRSLHIMHRNFHRCLCIRPVSLRVGRYFLDNQKNGGIFQVNVT